MRLLEAPQIWIAAAVVLLVIALVLLLLARRQRRSPTTDTGVVPAAPASGVDDDSAESTGVAVSTARAEAANETAAVDPPTDPVDVRPAAAEPETTRPETTTRPEATTRPATESAPEPEPATTTTTPATTTAAPAAAALGAGSAAKDRLLAVLLDDPDAALDAVSAIDRSNGSGPPGASVASLLRAGMSPAQVASLCGVRESSLAEIVARDLGLLTGRNATAEPGRAWASAGSAAGSTTPTTG